MALSKARVRRLKQSFNKGSGRNVTQFAQRRKTKKEKTSKVQNRYIQTINWFNIIVKKILRKDTPERSEEIEFTTQAGDYLLTETGLAYIIAE